MLRRWPAAEQRFIRLGPIAGGQAARQVKAGAQDPRWMVEEVHVRRKLVGEEWKGELGGGVALASAEQSCSAAELHWTTTACVVGEHEGAAARCGCIFLLRAHGTTWTRTLCWP
jgi:hypothetical protein